MSKAEIEADFPALYGTDYHITSEATADYNCFAWAANDTSAWWSPLPTHGYYWPDHLPRNMEVATFVRLYAEKGGYIRCETGDPEVGTEKIALYADSNGNVTHAARSAGGGWTSKLGTMEDVHHDTLHGLEGIQYGRVVCFLKREIPGFHDRETELAFAIAFDEPV